MYKSSRIDQLRIQPDDNCRRVGDDDGDTDDFDHGAEFGAANEFAGERRAASLFNVALAPLGRKPCGRDGEESRKDGRLPGGRDSLSGAGGFSALLSCGGVAGGNGTPPPPVIVTPGAANLFASVAGNSWPAALPKSNSLRTRA
jgi:hypothetical protein